MHLVRLLLASTDRTLAEKCWNIHSPAQVEGYLGKKNIIIIKRHSKNEILTIGAG